MRAHASHQEVGSAESMSAMAERNVNRHNDAGLTSDQMAFATHTMSRKTPKT
jgi:hypothetical protein